MCTFYGLTKLSYFSFSDACTMAKVLMTADNDGNSHRANKSGKIRWEKTLARNGFKVYNHLPCGRVWQARAQKVPQASAK